MISSFFSKAKPIHFVVVSILLLLVFVLTKISALHQPFTFELFGKQTFYFSVCLISLFVLDFFASRNNLTKKNSYKLLMFVLFVAMLPETLLNSKILISNLFILLALRRLISLRSQKEIKKKLFDSAFWISLACLFYFWSILFLILIFLALLLYSIVNLKNWIIPLVGILTVAVIMASAMIMMDLSSENYINNLTNYSFDFTNLNSKRIIIGATILISYGIWGSFYFIKDLKTKSKSLRPSFVLIIFSSLIALAIILIAPNKTGSEFLFLFAPLSIIMTNYLEVTKEKWFKEALIWVLILIPVASLML